MSDILIGPGNPCWECGEVYGQHTKKCSIGKQEKKERAEEKAEDAITKVELLKRIELLEAIVKGKP